jgi:16S rRNA (uracil1498-N3)-methyltransferase
VHWFYDQQLSEQTRTLTPDEQRHAKSLRIRAGEQLTLTNGTGLVGIASVQSLDPIELEILSVQQQPEPKISFHLVQALAKHDRDELALQTAVELGLTSITPWQSKRSIVKWDGKEQRNQQRWQLIALEAMKQSQQSHLATVNPVSTVLPQAGEGVAFYLDPRSDTTIERLPAAASYTIVVGPEGGIDPSEQSQLDAQGYLGIRIGASILRSSTAGPAAIAALQALHGSFRS